MKETFGRKTPTIVLLLSSIGILLSLSGCATKGPKKVYAFPQAQPIPAPTNWAVESAPRTQPGKIMDPDSVVYAQVPSRIIYLPGKSGVFGRTSSSQEVAYNLVPVDRIGEIIRGSSPRFDKKPDALMGRMGSKNQEEEPETRLGTKETFTTVIPQEDGTVVRGEARRLGITEESDREKRRAQAMLRGKEVLMWKPGVGWVGFIQERETVIPDPSPKGSQKQEPNIPPILDINAPKPLPDLQTPKQTPQLPPVLDNTPQDPENNPSSSSKPSQDGGEKEGTTMDLP